MYGVLHVIQMERLMSKYELIIQYEGDWEGAADFAAEILAEFGCPVLINEVDDNGNVVKGLLDKPDKPDKPG